MPDVDTKSDLDLIRDAAAEAGRIAMRYFGNKPEVWMKGGVSPVTEADLAVDRFLKHELLAARPDYGWISEETVDDRKITPRRKFFVVDPIDGTRAFIEGGDVWCVSIAVIEHGRPLEGVLDCPVRGEVFSAVVGGGAVQNGKPLAARAGDEPFRIGGPKPWLKNLPERFAQRITPTSYVPSLAYRVAMVARGDIAGTFIKPNSHDWDLAAADLILAEAGGKVLTAKGTVLKYGQGDYRHDSLVAASGSLLDEMLTVVAEASFG